MARYRNIEEFLDDQRDIIRIYTAMRLALKHSGEVKILSKSHTNESVKMIFERSDDKKYIGQATIDFPDDQEFKVFFGMDGVPIDASYGRQHFIRHAVLNLDGEVDWSSPGNSEIPDFLLERVGLLGIISEAVVSEAYGVPSLDIERLWPDAYLHIEEGCTESGYVGELSDAIYHASNEYGRQVLEKNTDDGFSIVREGSKIWRKPLLEVI
jgi:hypothetical protein